MNPSILRLVRFRPTGPGFDRSLRANLIPEAARLPGNRAVFAGRRGPGENGPRLVATLWQSHSAMVDAVGEQLEPPVFHPELLETTTDRSVVTLPVAVAFDPEPGAEVTIIRLVIGRTNLGSLDDYVARAREGTVADRELQVGPRALYLAVDPPDGFVTLSLWETWANVQEATGAEDAEIRTRHADRLAEWHAEHYEALPGCPIRAVAETMNEPESRPKPA